MIVEARNLSKRYKDVNALEDVNLSLAANRIYGLLGRNGAGKTTLMSILTAQAFATSGDALVFGKAAYENDAVLSRICFIRESQKYPDDFQPRHAFRSAALFYKNWDQGFAELLAEEFQLPMKRRIKKLSRGQLSAVGVIIGLASRAELTFFDEPYLGLDAVARQLFYDRLVQDYAEFPRTIILSSHLIDEVANLLEHVVVIDRGRIIMMPTPTTSVVRPSPCPGPRTKWTLSSPAAPSCTGKPWDPSPRSPWTRRWTGRQGQKRRNWGSNCPRFRCSNWWYARPWPARDQRLHSPNPNSQMARWSNPMSRTMAVARMQLINRWTFIGWPLVILASSFLMSLAIFALIPVDEAKYGGGSQAPLWYFMVLGIQSMTLVFPFSQGLSISRKASTPVPWACLQ